MLTHARAHAHAHAHARARVRRVSRGTGGFVKRSDVRTSAGSAGLVTRGRSHAARGQFDCPSPDVRWTDMRRFAVFAFRAEFLLRANRRLNAALTAALGASECGGAGLPRREGRAIASRIAFLAVPRLP